MTLYSEKPINRNSRPKTKRRRNNNRRRTDETCWDWYNTGKCERDGCRWLHNEFPSKTHPLKYEKLLKIARQQFSSQWPPQKMKDFERALSSDFSLVQINVELDKDFKKIDELKLHALAAELTRIVLEMKSQRSE